MTRRGDERTGPSGRPLSVARASEQPLRIAYVTDQFLPWNSADANQIAAMASAFGLVGAALTLVLPAYPRRLVPTAPQIGAYYGVEPSFEVLPLTGPYPAPLELRGMEKVAHALTASRRLSRRLFDVIYTRNLPVVLGAVAGSRLPVIYETHRAWGRDEIGKRATFRALKDHPRLRGLVVHSRRARDWFADNGFRPEDITVAHDGAHFEGALAPALERDEARRRLGLDRDAALVVYAGQLAADKGVGHLIELAERVPTVTVVLVGSTGVGEIEARARALANVKLVPWLAPHHLEGWLAAADVLAIPPAARKDPLAAPHKTIQYLAAGRAIVGPAVPETDELLRDGDNARLVRPGDIVGLCDAVQSLLADRAERERLGRNARASIEGNSWEARARELLAFLERRS